MGNNLLLPIFQFHPIHYRTRSDVFLPIWPQFALEFLRRPINDGEPMEGRNGICVTHLRISRPNG